MLTLVKIDNFHSSSFLNDFNLHCQVPVLNYCDHYALGLWTYGYLCTPRVAYVISGRVPASPRLMQK